MKITSKLLIAILMIFPLVGGFILGVDYATPPIKSCEMCEKDDYIEKNIVTVLDNMYTIFDRHNIYDVDGSDEMSELLEAQSNLAEIYNW